MIALNKREQVLLRLPVKTNEVLTEKAKQQGISKNAYILTLINKAIKK